MTSTDSGPVLSRWLLSTQLVAARKAAGLDQAAVARELGKHDKTVGRWELGDVVIGKLELRVLCDLYQVSAEARAELDGLRESATRPGWWNGHGKWPDVTFELLGMELAANRIRAFDMTVIPGLLQTPEYARVVIQSVEPDNSLTEVDAGVDLRMGRQAKVFDQSAKLREASFVVDEHAFARMPGSPAVQRAQLVKLLALPHRTTLQIVPFSAGLHPARGSFLIFDFDSDTIRAGVYAEGSLSAKSVVETGTEVGRYEQVWAWLQAKALSVKESTQFLKDKLERITDE